MVRLSLSALLCVVLLDGRAAGQIPYTVELSAATTTPFVGQVVDLTLRIKGTPPAQTEVVIPWLTETNPRWTWVQPTKEWQTRMSQAQAGALALKWQQSTVYMSKVSPGVYEWRWQIVLGEPHYMEDVAVRFSAVKVGALSSPALVLEVQRPPVMASSPGVWNLGVGKFTVTAEWQGPRVVLGQEMLLRIIIAGQGDLARLSSPNLASMPGWERDAVLIEPKAATWQGPQRLFPYAVRPRRLGTLTPAGLLVRWFSPEKGSWQTQQVRVPALEVVSTLETTAKAGGPLYVQDARALLHPKWIEYQEAVPPSFDNPRWSDVALWLPLVAMVLIVGRAWMERWRPAWWERVRRRWASRTAARRFAQAGEELTPPEARKIVADWLAVRMERPCAPEFETVNAGLRVVRLDHRFEPLMRAVQAWEFGPGTAVQRFEVQELAQTLFRQTTEDA